MCMSWRGFVCWPIRKRRRHPPRSSATSSSSPSTKQEGPTVDLESISPRQRPTATTEEVPTLNPGHVSTPQSTLPALPPTGQGAPTLVPEFVSTPTLPPTTTTTNQEDPVPVPAPNPGAVSTPPPPAKTTSASSIAKTAGNGLVVALKLLKEAVTGVGIPGLEATVSGVVAIIDLVQDVRDNADDLGDLNGLISNLAHTISMSPDLHQGVKEVPGLLRSRIDMFLLGLHGLMTEVQKMLSDKNPVIRAANSQAHKQAIEGINTRINFLLSQFTAQGTLSLELNMAGARQDIQGIQLLAEAQAALALAREYEDLIKAIPRAGARYNDTSTKPSRPCHPGTRKELLGIITKWIVGDADAKAYFWLCGEVGVGKTTVAHTIALEQHDLKCLGASFFFSRHDESRRNPDLLFTSIAYQLARFDQGFYNALAKVLKPEPDIVKRTPLEQFRRLVLEPLSESGMESSRTVVIVIDGLDECSKPATILDVLAEGINNVGVRLRVLISSRPYSTILTKFEESRLCQLTDEKQFHDIRPGVLDADVAAYLSAELEAIASRSSRLQSPWPPKAQLDQLIRRAAGLMIVASTYAKYIDDSEEANPSNQLKRILSMEECVGDSPLTELDALYSQVLIDLKSKLTTKPQATNAREILAFVILAPEGINVSALAGLLGVTPSYVRSVLRRLTAVVLLPDDDDDNIAPFHASFGEYIQDPMRCTIRELSVDTAAAYSRIAAQCSNIVASAVNDGIIGVEYEAARGKFWFPKHWEHLAKNLAFYLSHSPPDQAEALKATFVGTCAWELVNIALAAQILDTMIELIEATGISPQCFKVQRSSELEKSISFALPSILNHTSTVNRMLEDSMAMREPTLVDTSQPSHRQIYKIHLTSDGSSARDKFLFAMCFVRNVRCWMKYAHSNIMSFDAINVKVDNNDVSQDILLFVSLPFGIQQLFSLQQYLHKEADIDGTARARIAMGVADGLCYLHGSSPPQPHNGINPYQIAVSGEGLPILYPSRWDLDFGSRPLPNNKDDVDGINCRWIEDFDPPNPGWYHWNPVEGDRWQESLEARLQVDVWDFGSILYQMISGEEPLLTYNCLAEGDEASDYEPPTEDNDISFENLWNLYRYESAVPLLLNSLQASEDMKALLKSCWSIRPQDRPPMSEVFERLKKVVKDLER